MQTEPSSAPPPTQPRRVSSPSWLQTKELWAGASIMMMWLAVLFVGVFGGDFISTNSTGFTKIPVVVFMLPFVLPATIAVARRGFTPPRTERATIADAEPGPRGDTPAEHSKLRAKPA